LHGIQHVFTQWSWGPIELEEASALPANSNHIKQKGKSINRRSTMSYIIKRCVVCKTEIHLHKNGTHFELRGACEHIPKEKVNNCRDGDLKQLFMEYRDW
jgi:hypothetical protein